MAYAEQLIDHYKDIRNRLKGRTVPIVRSDLCRPAIDAPKLFTPPEYLIPRTPSQRIVDAVLEKREKYWHQVFSYDKLAKPSLIRNEVWWELRQAGYTLMEIGRICRPERPYDHSTVLHGIRRHQKLVDDRNAKQIS